MISTVHLWPLPGLVAARLGTPQSPAVVAATKYTEPCLGSPRTASETVPKATPATAICSSRVSVRAA
jgi:hypothetical protein